MKLGWSYYENGAAAWFGDGEEGALVGQDFKSTNLAKRLEAARKKASNGDTDSREEVEYLVVEIAAHEWAKAKVNQQYVEVMTAGIRLTDAPARLTSEYMRVLKSALAKAHDTTPWPEWTKLAQAAGWKPPKGWKP